jgi:hypothetical protein
VQDRTGFADDDRFRVPLSAGAREQLRIIVNEHSVTRSVSFWL